MKQCQGFILLVVLIFMQIFALLALTTLLQAAMLTRATFHQFQTDNLRRSAEYVLPQLEKTSFFPCLIPPLPAASLSKKTLVWWEAHGCAKAIDRQKFYYTWERLEPDRCVFIDKKLTTVGFYRLSVFVAEHNASIVLQSVMALSQEKKPLCKNSHYSIMLGRQMYRMMK